MQEQSNPKVLPDQCHARGGYGGQSRWTQVYHISVLGQSRGTRLFKPNNFKGLTSYWLQGQLENVECVTLI